MEMMADHGSLENEHDGSEPATRELGYYAAQAAIRDQLQGWCLR